MDISTEDSKKISYILNIGNLILEEYKLSGTDDFSHDELIAYFEMEDSLYATLNLTPELKRFTETLVKEKIGANLNSPLPAGISPLMTDFAYPYIRLLARLRYCYDSQSEKLDTFAKTTLQDLEIGLFYKSLLLTSRNNPEYSERLEKYACMILIDSPRIEKSIVQNDMNPLDRIDDIFNFSVDVWCVNQVRAILNKLGVPSLNNTRFKRENRFTILYSAIVDLTKRYVTLQKKSHDAMAQILMAMSYFKAIIACQPPKRRCRLYAKFEEMEIDLIDLDFKALIHQAQFDIENHLVPSIWQFDFIDKQKIH